MAKLKEQLVELGLTEEQAEKVAKEVIDGNYIPKSRFDEANEENKNLKKSVEERDKQLEDLKKSTGDSEALQKQIAELQKANKEQKASYDAELAKIKLDNALDNALSDAKAKNGKAVKGMLDLSKVKLGEDGKLAGLDEQIEALKKSDAYMFNEDTNKETNFKGFQPGGSSLVPDSTVAGYEAKLADARKNNNQLEIIKIKQEAAAEGVALL